MLKKVLLVLMLLPGLTQADLGSSFAPENDEKRPVLKSSPKAINGMTKEIFNEILDRVKDVYEPLVAEQGAVFEIQRDWSNSTVNAYAQQIGNRWIIKMFGGLARHEKITPDGFALVACHEMGHHLGGAPLYAHVRWASNEGQADYYTTLKCSRKIWENDDNVAIINQRITDGKVDEYALKACGDIYSNAEEKAICVRAAMGGFALGTLLGHLGRTGDVDFQTPDKKVVTRTQDRHPHAQCRLDTYFQAALCSVSHDINPDIKSETIGMCTRAEKYSVGNRPLCWYRP
ncbi:MAG: hypothetical protein ACPGJV_13665 [Bacteriovoracaceae bacterium]